MLRGGARVFFWRFEDIEEETKKWYLYLFIYLYFEQHPQEKGKKKLRHEKCFKGKKNVSICWRADRCFRGIALV